MPSITVLQLRRTSSSPTASTLSSPSGYAYHATHPHACHSPSIGRDHRCATHLFIFASTSSAMCSLSSAAWSGCRPELVPFTSMIHSLPVPSSTIASTVRMSRPPKMPAAASAHACQRGSHASSSITAVPVLVFHSPATSRRRKARQCAPIFWMRRSHAPTMNGSAKQCSFGIIASTERKSLRRERQNELGRDGESPTHLVVILDLHLSRACMCRPHLDHGWEGEAVHE
mmetsp:Transcript_67028/g.183841  ORF Transcript_67028/g.183841 Transcript_67028/m.183841 type:complete len:229 (-) Transcript_67028:574-1260(-)